MSAAAVASSPPKSAKMGKPMSSALLSAFASVGSLMKLLASASLANCNLASSTDDALQIGKLLELHRSHELVKQLDRLSRELLVQGDVGMSRCYEHVGEEDDER
jgi:hypothetical protein